MIIPAVFLISSNFNAFGILSGIFSRAGLIAGKNFYAKNILSSGFDINALPKKVKAG